MKLNPVLVFSLISAIAAVIVMKQCIELNKMNKMLENLKQEILAMDVESNSSLTTTSGAVIEWAR